MNRFGIEGLRAAGEATDSTAIISAVTFLLSHQNRNGGWGESHFSGLNKTYGNGTASLNEGWWFDSRNVFNVNLY